MTLRIAEHQAPLCFTISHSWLKFMPIESVGCYQVISSSATPFSFCSQSFPASQSFPVDQLLASGGWHIGASASALVLPMYIQGQGNWKWGHRTLGIEISGLSSTHLNRNPHFFSLSHDKLSGMWWGGGREDSSASETYSIAVVFPVKHSYTSQRSSIHWEALSQVQWWQWPIVLRVVVNG